MHTGVWLPYSYLWAVVMGKILAQTAGALARLSVCLDHLGEKVALHFGFRTGLKTKANTATEWELDMSTVPRKLHLF